MNIFNTKILIALLKTYWNIKTNILVFIYLIMIILSLFLSIFFANIEVLFKIWEFFTKNFLLIQLIFFIIFLLFPSFLFLKKYIYDNWIWISFLNIEKVKTHLYELDFNKEKLAWSYNIQVFLFFQQLILTWLLIIIPFFVKVLLWIVFLLPFFLYYFFLIFFIIIIILNIYWTFKCYFDFKEVIDN